MNLSIYWPEQKEWYSHTKAVAEEKILAANGIQGLLTVALRGSTLFGERDTTCSPHMIANARAGRAKFQIGDGTNLYDFTYLGNIAHAHILAAKALLEQVPRAEDRRVDGEAMVVTNGEPWPFWDAMRAFARAAGYPVEKKDVWRVPVFVYWLCAAAVELWTWVVSFGTREPHVERKMVRYLTMPRYFDITKARDRLGYRPIVNMQEAIDRTVKWHLAQEPGTKRTD